MEDLNQNVTEALSPNYTQNGSEPNKEEVAIVPWLATTNDNNDEPEGARVEALPGSIAGEAPEVVSPIQMVKRGRGRPLKYEVDWSHLPPATSPPPGFAILPVGGGVDSEKRGRGRPRGSGKLQILASAGGLVADTAGGDLKPYVVVVNTGEDLVSKLTSSIPSGPTAVSLISGNGVVSSVTLQIPDSTDPLTYEGQFEILTLSGSCTSSIGAGGTHTKSWVLNVTLSKPDGQVFGGRIESSLIADSPIQLILATFKENISKEIKKRNLIGSSDSPSMPNPDSVRGDLQKVPRLTEGEPSFISPTSTTNGIADNSIPEKLNPVPEKVIHANENMYSDLEFQTLQPNVGKQRASGDGDDASAP